MGFPLVLLERSSGIFWYLRVLGKDKWTLDLLLEPWEWDNPSTNHLSSSVCADGKNGDKSLCFLTIYWNTILGPFTHSISAIALGNSTLASVSTLRENWKGISICFRSSACAFELQEKQTVERIFKSHLPILEETLASGFVSQDNPFPTLTSHWNIPHLL